MAQADGSMGDGTGRGRRRGNGRPLDPSSVSALEALFALEAAEPVRPRQQAAPTEQRPAPTGDSAPEQRSADQAPVTEELPAVRPAAREPRAARSATAGPAAPARTPERRAPDTGVARPASTSPGTTSPAPTRPAQAHAAAPGPAARRPAFARRPDAVFSTPRWHWLGLLIAATVLGGVALALASLPTATPTERGVGSASLASAIMALLFAARYARGRVVLSDEGVAVRGVRTSRRRWSTVADVGVKRVSGGHAVELLLLDGRSEVLPLPVTRRASRAQRVAADARARRAAAPRLLS